ncbi:hypothetical protein F4560_001399 [Saccharothrix ecbatanensis]|uniref:DUF5709 domain-containing protein n=1 Tax=Saccharothrix ecbatanensis TaxID=1105145 RepID=A0A7W9HGM0_9PSEU|nr:hypothetical protein [Saccharothrix ecbatanensis]MBB5801631.1 hypothetical protein [Saccharothrix ecbatanensis]
MADERSVSEQQEELDLRRDTGQDHRRQRATDAAGPQYTAHDGGGDLTDDEPTAIADEAGSSYPRGPEQDAMHVEEER